MMPEQRLTLPWGWSHGWAPVHAAAHMCACAAQDEEGSDQELPDASEDDDKACSDG